MEKQKMTTPVEKLTTTDLANQTAQAFRENSNPQGLSRAQRRKRKRQLTKWQSTFTQICEGFASKFLEHGGDQDDPELTMSFDKHNNYWKNFAAAEIWKCERNNDKSMSKSEIRTRFINKFEDFANNLLDNTSKKESINNDTIEKPMESTEATNKYKRPTVEELGIERTRAILATLGIKTTAKTISGLQKRLDEVSDSDLEQFED